MSLNELLINYSAFKCYYFLLKWWRELTMLLRKPKRKYYENEIDKARQNIKQTGEFWGILVTNANPNRTCLLDVNIMSPILPSLPRLLINFVLNSPILENRWSTKFQQLFTICHILPKRKLFYLFFFASNDKRRDVEHPKHSNVEKLLVSTG